MCQWDRRAENCNAEVTTEDAVRGDKPSNGLVENTVMLFRGVIRTIECHVESCTREELREDSPILPWLVEHAGSILSRCQKGRDGRTPFEKITWQEANTRVCVVWREGVGETLIFLNRMNLRYKFGVWLGVRNNSAECFIGTAEGVFTAREGRRLEPQSRWDKEAVHNVIGVLWRLTDGRWTVDRPDVQEDPVPIPPLPFEGARIQRERSTKQDIEIFGATVGCHGCKCDQRQQRGHRPIQIAAGHELKCGSESIPQGAERLDPRSEVINEALAEEVRRAAQRKETGDDAAAAVPEPEPATLAARDPRESPV